jgi:hypothetical protein
MRLKSSLIELVVIVKAPCFLSLSCYRSKAPCFSSWESVPPCFYNGTYSMVLTPTVPSITFTAGNTVGRTYV